MGACLKKLAPAAGWGMGRRGESEWPLQKDEGAPALWRPLAVGDSEILRQALATARRWRVRIGMGQK